jgi:hypothetical protein
MKAFNLKEALAGEKVIDNDGDEVTQLTNFKTSQSYCLAGLCRGSIEKYTELGGHCDGANLFMANKKLSGFINAYKNGHVDDTTHETKEVARISSCKTDIRIACIDLSQFEEGHGL